MFKSQLSHHATVQLAAGHAGHGAWLLTRSCTLVLSVCPPWPACSTHPMDWNNTSHELVQREPRRGRRLTLAALVHAEQRPPLLVYSVHLEVLLALAH